jgi:hypothetical protein
MTLPLRLVILRFLSYWLIALMLTASSMAQSASTNSDDAKNSQDVPPSSDVVAIFEVGKDISAPKLVKFTEAVYPESKDGQHLRVNANCLLGFVVDTTGMPQDIHTVRCTNLAFEKNSTNAVSTYRFKPARRSDGTPVAVKIAVEVKFRRDDAPNEPNFCQPDGSAQPILHLGLNISKSSGANQPDNAGIYELSPGIIPPKLIHFEDRGFCEAAFTIVEASCEVPFTLDIKGKVKAIGPPQCKQKNLDDKAVQLLRLSRFQPATLNGAPVAIHTVIKINYGETSPHP